MLAYSSLFPNNQAYSSIFKKVKHIPAYSSLFHPIPPYSSLFQPIPALFQPYSSLVHFLNLVHARPALQFTDEGVACPSAERGAWEKKTVNLICTGSLWYPCGSWRCSPLAGGPGHLLDFLLSSSDGYLAGRQIGTSLYTRITVLVYKIIGVLFYQWLTVLVYQCSVPVYSSSSSSSSSSSPCPVDFLKSSQS